MPPAILTWLDYSEADQRRAREIVAMFSHRESRDELGLGRIRDALSDTLFPGTSVLLTRARYFLFIPWLYREGGRRGYTGQRLASRVEYWERSLISALREGGDHEGLIGRNVGEAVQNLPSSIYWISLRRFGILRHEGTPAQTVGLSQVSRPQVDATEYLHSPVSVWSPSLPEPPDDFLDLTRCDFALTRDEATWLTERIVDAAPGTLLEFLVARWRRRPVRAEYAWEDADAAAAPGGVRESLDEARRFAVAMHGASLLYNVLLAERAESLGLTEHDGSRDRFADSLERWQDDIESGDIRGWDLGGLWALVAGQGRPAAAGTRRFVTDWVDLARSRSGLRLAEDRRARDLVERRELLQKRGQARLRNERLMRQWGGASGSERLNFRWPAVSRLLDDIADGRENGLARAG